MSGCYITCKNVEKCAERFQRSTFTLSWSADTFLTTSSLANLPCVYHYNYSCTYLFELRRDGLYISCVDPEGGGGFRIPLGNHKAIGSHSNTGPDPLKNHKATKPAFRWMADDDPLLVVFGSSLSSSAK